jgi:GT2 family glycosyltransferase
VAAPGEPGAAALPAAAAGPPPVEHRLARLPGGVVLLELNRAVPAEGAGGASLVVEGAPLPPPSALLSFPARPDAPPRTILGVRDAAGLLRPGAACVLLLGGTPAAAFAPDVPVPAEALALGGREPGDHERLLRFLVGTCAPALRAAADPDLAALCHSLARAALADGGGAEALSHPGAPLSAWAVPPAAAGARPGGGAWRLLSRGAVRRIAPPEGGVLLLEEAPAAGAVLLPPAPAAPLALRSAAGAGAPLPSLAALAREALRPDGAAGDARLGAAGRRLLPALFRRARTDPRCAALLREAQLLAPARPQKLDDPARPVGGALELALSDGGGGLFLCGWLRDPLALVAGLELSGPAGPPQPIPPAALHRVARPDLAERFARAPLGGAGLLPGFLAHLPAADHPGVAQWRLGLRLASGASLALTAPPGVLPPEAARDLVLRSAHPDALRPGLLDACIAPAAERLHAAVLRGWSGEPEVVSFGAAPTPALRVAVVVPLYRTLRFLRFQIAAFARDPEVRDAADLVFVLDSPEQRAEVEPLLRGLSALHGGLALRLAVMPGNRGYAAACNAGAALARADTLLFLNSDVLPAAPGWLPPLLERLRRDPDLAAVGPKLLFEDGSVQHAGMVFRRDASGEWFNDHRCKGYPRSHPDAAAGGPVPAVTGAALCVRRRAFEAAGGFDTGYVIGDFEDSDLCLKLRAAGGGIAYEPASELFHFERQSVSAHEGHARTLAGAHNRRRHHRRWGAAMADLMARFPEDA